MEYECCLLLVDMAGWNGAQLVEYECCLLLVDIAGWTGTQLLGCYFD